MELKKRRDNAKNDKYLMSAKGKFFDYSLLIIVLFLVAFGLVMVYSTSSYVAVQKFGDATFYLRKQMIAAGLGLALMFFMTFFDYHILYKFSLPVFIFSLLFLFTTRIPGLEHPLNGAHRWILIRGMSLQPSEIVKLTLIIVLASFLTWSGNKFGKRRNGRLQPQYSIVFLSMGAIATLLVYIVTDHLSAAIILFAITYILYIVAHPRPIWLYIASAVVGAAGVAALVLFFKYADVNDLGSFRLQRLAIWRNPGNYDLGWQTVQALYAIGAGGFTGRGLGTSIQKLGFVPEAQNDMIFSIICEELGLFGAICVILLYILMVYRFWVIANRAPDRLGGLLATGVMAHIAVQVVLNIAVVTNTVPNTGISLPFISYGGTSLMLLMAEMGIVLNVSRQIQVREGLNPDYEETEPVQLRTQKQ